MGALCFQKHASANGDKDAGPNRKLRQSGSVMPLYFSISFDTAFRISFPTPVSRSAKQSEPVAPQGRTQRTDLASVAR